MIDRTLAHCGGHGVIDVADHPLGAVLAILRFIFALDDGKGLQNVVHVVARDAVEVEVGSVEFAAE